MPENFSNREKFLNDNLRKLPAHYIFNQSKSLLLLKKPNQFSDLPIKINYAKTQLIDIYPTIKKFSGQKLIKKDNNMMSLLEPIPDDRIIKYFVGYKQRKSSNHPWTTIEKEKGGFIDLFEISKRTLSLRKIGFMLGGKYYL